MIVTEVSFFEHYEKQPMFEDIYLFLKEKGFKLNGMFEWLYDRNRLPLQCNAVFINEAFFSKIDKHDT